jgi:hypothetical protein
LLEHGCRNSGTFRGLVAHIEASDLIVYVRTEPSRPGDPAVEIADDTDLVDEPAMAKLYVRIGRARTAKDGKRRFDSDAAVSVGCRVFAEIKAPRFAADHF